MNAVLLHTKVHLPSLRSERVQRMRLFHQLDAGLQGKLILLSAPAGYGKTTLVSAWIQERDLPAGWLSLEEDDNDPARFWAYFIAALQTVDTSLGADLLARLRAASLPPDKIDLTGLLDEVDRIPADFVLVLDDYHVIDDACIQDGVFFLLEHLPPPMHLVISTRADPPWPLARLRSRSEVCALRGGDLRFTLDETRELLNSLLGLDLPAEDISALDARIEGWAAGLQLSALSLQGQADKSQLIRRIGRSQRFLLDYLGEEVLERQSHSLKDFLLKSSILERLTAPLCNALLQIDHSQAILQQLEGANLFLLPLDDERRWYRYHSLFAELLRTTLAQKEPAALPRLHRRASQWCVENGLISAAVNHASAAGDVEFVARLVEDNALTIITIYNDQIGVLAGWLDSLPEEMIQSRPWLAMARLWLLAYSGELAAAESHIQQAEASILSAAAAGCGQDHLLGALAAMRAYLAFMQGDFAAAGSWIAKAVPLLPSQDIPTRVFAAVVASAAAGLQGDLAGGVRTLREAAALFRGNQNPLFTLMLLSELTGLQILQGQLSAVIDTCQEAIDLAGEYTRRVGREPSNIGFAHARLSYVLREQNDLPGAIAHARHAVSISLRWGQKDCLRLSWLYLALALQAARQECEALHMAAQARQVAADLSPRDEAITAAYQAKLHHLQGNHAFLIRWAEGCSLRLDETPAFGRMREYLVYGRALLASSQLSDCLAFLQRLLPLVQAAGALGFEIEISILQALALRLLGEPVQAQQAFGRALRLAEPQGYVRIFLDEGDALTDLLRQAARISASAAYARRLLAAHSASPDTGMGTPLTAPPLTTPSGETLTRREAEILQLLMTSLPVAEISHRLCITTSTLRTHMRSIYAKLGAHSRIEAASIARSLKLP